MNAERSGIVSGQLVKRIALCDVLILGLAAGVAWLLGWRTWAGIGRSLLWTGAVVLLCGGAAALVQSMLARASRAMDLPSDRSGGILSALAHALSGEDAVLQMLILVSGSGLLWGVTGAIIGLVAG